MASVLKSEGGREGRSDNRGCIRNRHVRKTEEGHVPPNAGSLQMLRKARKESVP